MIFERGMRGDLNYTTSMKAMINGVFLLAKNRLTNVANYGSPAAFTVVRFDPTGRYVFVGTSNGSILVFHSRTKIVRVAYLIALHFLTLFSFLRGTRFPAQALCGDSRLPREGAV